MSTSSKNDPQPIGGPRKLQLLTAEDLARILQISIRTLWRQVSLGKIPKPKHIGRLARWRQQEIENWLDECSE